MGMVQKTYIIMLCMNLFLVIFINNQFDTGQNTIIDNFINLNGDKANFDGTTLNESVPSSYSESTAVVGGSGLSLIDVIATIWSFITFILTWLFAPVVLIYIIPNIPIYVAALFLIPNVLILVFGTISFIRGANL